MRRRTFIGSGTAAGLAALAGCAGILGESQETLDAIEDASDALLAAQDALTSQLEAFDRLETYEYDADAVQTHISTARDDLDAAAETARLDETLAEIEALRRVADFAAARNEVGAGLTSAYSTTAETLSAYEDEYETTLDDLDAARTVLSGVEDHLAEMDEARNAIDPERLRTLTVEDLDETVDDVYRQYNGTDLLLDGSVPAIRGDRDQGMAFDAWERDEYEVVVDRASSSSGFYGDAAAAFGRHETVDLTEEMRAGLADLEALNAGYVERMRMLAAFGSILVSMNAATTDLSTASYDDALRDYRAADGHLDSARDHFETATETLSPLSERDSAFLEDLVVGTSDHDIEDFQRNFGAFESLLAGMMAYTKGLGEFQAGVVAGESARYETADDHLGTAIDHFDSAESAFVDVQGRSTEQLPYTFSTLICLSNAFADTSRLYGEGYAALAAGDTETARARFQEADEAAARGATTGI